MYGVAVANNSWRKHHYLRKSSAFNSGKHYYICVYSIYVYVVGTSKVVKTFMFSFMMGSFGSKYIHTWRIQGWFN